MICGAPNWPYVRAGQNLSGRQKTGEQNPHFPGKLSTTYTVQYVIPTCYHSDCRLKILAITIYVFQFPFSLSFNPIISYMFRILLSVNRFAWAEYMYVPTLPSASRLLHMCVCVLSVHVLCSRFA